MTLQTRRAPQRRVRHDVAEGATVMLFSFLVSLGIAAAAALALSIIGGLW